MITTGIIQDVNPQNYSTHYFGLPKQRWNFLKGKTFWITGAGTGFGQAIAVGLVAAGAQVFITGRRITKLQETIQEIKVLGLKYNLITPLVADITNEAQVTNAIELIQKACPYLYGLVHSAALPTPSAGISPLMDASSQQMNTILETNVIAPWLVTKLALKHMLKGESQRILFLTSEAGWAFTPSFGPYNMTKAALNNLGASFAQEIENKHPDKDIQANILVPGEARTEMNQGSTISPYSIVSMALTLLSHPKDGPNGCFFHRDGRHLGFAYAKPYTHSLYNEIQPVTPSNQENHKLPKRLKNKIRSVFLRSSI